MLNKSLFGLVFILFCAVLSKSMSYKNYHAVLKKEFERHLMRNLRVDKGTGCIIPNINPFSKNITNFKNDGYNVNCPGPDWVKCYHSECRVIPEILKNYTNITCYYGEIVHDSHWSYHTSSLSLVNGSGVYNLAESDHVAVKCSGNFKNKTESWLGLAVGIRPIEQPTSTNKLENSLNVVIFALEDLSKNGFIRYFPESYKFMKNEIGMTILNSYNVVGDGTSAAFFPLLTGQPEMNFLNSRSSVIKSDQTIFHKVGQLGYQTAYFEDKPWGKFKGPPADHYMRPFFLENAKVMERAKYGQMCVGDTLRFKLMVNITQQLLQLPGKIFGVTYVSKRTHDNNYGTSADTELVKLMKSLNRNGRMDDTMFIVMSDHGPSLKSEIGHTVLGKMEERLPLMAFYLPKNLLIKRPKASKNLKNNADVLATPHDVYATVMDALGLRHLWNPYKIPGADLKRGLSLLEPIPKDRSCSEAGIGGQWCSCLTVYRLADTDPMYKIVAEALVNHINALTSPVRLICLKRELTFIHWVNIYSPTHSLLNFTRPEDLNGDVEHFTVIKPEYIEKLNPEPVRYQIKITVSPGWTAYMATIEYSTQNQDFSVIRVTDLSGINANHNEAYCISKAMPQLNKFCYCDSNSLLLLSKIKI